MKSEFTGAQSVRQGLVRRANELLALDEIGEMPLIAAKSTQDSAGTGFKRIGDQ